MISATTTEQVDAWGCGEIDDGDLHGVERQLALMAAATGHCSLGGGITRRSS